MMYRYIYAVHLLNRGSFSFLFLFTAKEQLSNSYNPNLGSIQSNHVPSSVPLRAYPRAYIPIYRLNLPLSYLLRKKKPLSTSIHPNCQPLRPNPIHTPSRTHSQKHQSNLLTPTQTHINPSNPPNHNQPTTQ